MFRIPNFVKWFYPRRIWRFKKESSVFLTFDDGPHPEITEWLLDLLEKHQIKATFFWLGSQVEKYSQFLELALNAGHTVGHHGYEHASAKKQNLSEFRNNFDASLTLVPHTLYRPPYGVIKRKQARYALSKGQLVMWNWLSYDYDEKVPVERIIKRFSEDVKGGDVVVFHENDKSIERVKEIIPQIISIVRDKGLNFAALPKDKNEKFQRYE